MMNMKLKEELEILRGESIQVFEGDPMGIPCIETSNPEKLCKAPAVSVHMITYNHEPYIRQAIEGVMMQQTDFEFELVIGEDCSTDKTREICFEYQKKYPDKIRVLWWHKNLYRNPHSAGGNGRRTTAHCRGEFIAFCEGDDCWTDSLKLQKQVNAMRQNPSVGICFGDGIKLDNETREEVQWSLGLPYEPGLVKSEVFTNNYLFGANGVGGGPETFLLTASVMIRASAFRMAMEKFPILDWRLALGDAPMWIGVGAVSDAYYLADEVCMYRLLNTGAMSTNGVRVGRDAAITRYFYASFLGLKLSAGMQLSQALSIMAYCHKTGRKFLPSEIIWDWRGYIAKAMIMIGIVSPFWLRCYSFVCRRVFGVR